MNRPTTDPHDAVAAARGILAAAGVDNALILTDLPTVTEQSGDLEVDGKRYWRGTIEGQLEHARLHAALALHLQRNPEPDPQVVKLAELMRQHHLSRGEVVFSDEHYLQAAEALIDAGVKGEGGA